MIHLPCSPFSHQIPVFKGAAKPILGKSIDAGNFHGQDGLGDAPDPNAPSLDLVQKEDAVSALIRIINQNPGEVRGAHSCEVFGVFFLTCNTWILFLR